MCSRKKVSKVERNPISVLKEIIKEIIKIDDEEKKTSVEIIEKVGFIMKSHIKIWRTMHHILGNGNVQVMLACL